MQTPINMLVVTLNLVHLLPSELCCCVVFIVNDTLPSVPAYYLFNFIILISTVLDEDQSLIAVLLEATLQIYGLYWVCPI